MNSLRTYNFTQKYLKNMGITPKMSNFLVPLTKKEKSLNYLCTLNHTQNNEIY